jgi:hypothetical protein
VRREMRRWRIAVGLGKKEILRRVAPLDDGQVRVGAWTARLGEARRSMAALTKGWRSEDRRYESGFVVALRA